MKLIGWLMFLAGFAALYAGEKKRFKRNPSELLVAGGLVFALLGLVIVLFMP